MTGPMYNDPQKQELAERVSVLEQKLRDLARTARVAEQTNERVAERMEWSLAKWNNALDTANQRATQWYFDYMEVQRELTKTKAALEDALHDARRWKAFAESLGEAK